MLLALVCLWIGFAAGMVCASLLRMGSDDVAANVATKGHAGSEQPASRTHH